MAGVNMLHLPYRGQAPAMTDLLGGQVQVMFDGLAASIGHINGGAVRALAVTTAARAEALPELPTVSEFLPGFEASAWYGLAAPGTTPSGVIDRVNKEVNAAFLAPTIKERLVDLGGMVLAGPPAAFGKVIVEETEKWAKVVRTANIKAE